MGRRACNCKAKLVLLASSVLLAASKQDPSLPRHTPPGPLQKRRSDRSMTVRVQKKTHFVSVVGYPLRPHAASFVKEAARQRCEPFISER